MVRARVHGIDCAAVERAIGAAERATSGEIVVALSRFYFWGDVRRAAERAFVRLHIDRTRERNGVLIFVAPWRHGFAILGDDGIHRRVEDGFWHAAARALAEAFRRGDRTGGIVGAVETIGARLAVHFPVRSGTDQSSNQLPDRVQR